MSGILLLLLTGKGSYIYLFLRKCDDIFDMYINIKDGKILPTHNEIGVQNSFKVGYLIKCM